MTTIRTASRAALVALSLLLSACASKGPTTMHYDLGPLPQTAAAVVPTAPIAPLIVSDVSGAAALDSERMQYRLLYEDARQSRPYAYNQWTSNPLQLLTQRLKARIAQAGVKVLSSTDAASSITLLRVEADDFVQDFSSPTASVGRISLRASVFRNHRLVDQKTFNRSSPAPSADAAGGARALADASDAISDEMLAWLAALPRE